MTDIAAALGLSQLNRLDETIRKRQIVFETYQELLPTGVCRLQVMPPGSSWNVQTLGIDVGSENTRDAVLVQLENSNIQAGKLSYVASELLWNDGSLARTPNAEAIVRSSLTLPMYASMTEYEITRVTTAIREVIG